MPGVSTSTPGPATASTCDAPAPAGSQPWQHRLVGWMNRRKRLSVLVPVFVLVLGTPHSCPFC